MVGNALVCGRARRFYRYPPSERPTANTFPYGDPPSAVSASVKSPAKGTQKKKVHSGFHPLSEGMSGEECTQCRRASEADPLR